MSSSTLLYLKINVAPPTSIDYFLFKTYISRFWNYTKISNLKQIMKVNTFWRTLKTRICNLRTRKLLIVCLFKGSVCYIFASLFFKSKREQLWNLENVFYFASKSLFILKKIKFQNFRYSNSWRHQMPKNETRNALHWITWEVNTVGQWNLASLCHVTKEKKLSKNSTNAQTWKLVPDPFVFANNYA